MPRIDDEYDSMMNMMPSESSSESNLRANAAAKGSALARESYSEQRLRKNAKPMVKAKPKAKPMEKKVVGRAGAQTPSARAKLTPRGTPMRPTKPVGDRGMDARLAAKKAANKGTPMRPVTKVTKKASTNTGAPVRKKATNPAARAVVNILSGKGLRANNGMNAAQVAAENKRRAAASKRGK